VWRLRISAGDGETFPVAAVDVVYFGSLNVELSTLGDKDVHAIDQQGLFVVQRLIQSQAKIGPASPGLYQQAEVLAGIGAEQVFQFFLGQVRDR
jgi:hypothetical protein